MQRPGCIQSYSFVDVRITVSRKSFCDYTKTLFILLCMYYPKYNIGEIKQYYPNNDTQPKIPDEPCFIIYITLQILIDYAIIVTFIFDHN